MKNKGVSKSRMCISFETGKKCEHGKCRFAHNLAEFTPAKCLFGEKCKYIKKCMYLHPDEKKYAYCKRIGILQ